MITDDQLAVLRDIFASADDDWLRDHVTISNKGNRNFVIDIDNANWQDCDELFPGYYSAPKEKTRHG